MDEIKDIIKLLFLTMVNKIKIFFLIIYSKTPWYTALILSAWWKYKESELFRKRWIEFNQIEAAKLYTMEEHIHFTNKVREDKKLIKRIVWSPFSVIREKYTEDDEELRQYVEF